MEVKREREDPRREREDATVKEEGTKGHEKSRARMHVLHKGKKQEKAYASRGRCLIFWQSDLCLAVAVAIGQPRCISGTPARADNCFDLAILLCSLSLQSLIV